MNTPGHLSPGLWRHPRNKTNEYKRLDFWTELAQLLDKAGLHSLFLADVLGPYDGTFARFFMFTPLVRLAFGHG